MSSNEEPTSVHGVVKELKKEGGTSFIKEYKDIFSNPNGSDKKDDKVVESPAAALDLLKSMIEEKKTSIKKDAKKRKFDFAASPHEQFGKTLDDTFMAFLMWARVKQNETMINVSKAFRRAEQYADWMEDTGSDLIEPALSYESVRKGVDAWGMNSSYDAKDGSLIWWFDAGSLDRDYIKENITPEDSLRAFVWYSHAILYNEQAQKNGLKFVCNMAKMGMVSMFTLMPAKLSAKLDRLTIGVLPIKMQAMYLLESPVWINIFMGILGMFMSKKMKERIISLKKWEELNTIFDITTVPVKFGKVEGKLEKNVIG